MKAKSSSIITTIVAFMLIVNTSVFAEKNITKSGIKIKAKDNPSLATNYFGVIDFEFKNTTQDWIRIKQVKAFFNDDKKDRNINFTSGRDFVIWAQATQKMKAIDAQKAKIVLSIIAGLGIAAFSSDTNIKTVGAMATIGAISSLSIMEFNKRYDQVEKAKIFPENHIFASEFVIPPGLYVKRFLVLNSRNHKDIGYINKIFLEVQVKEYEPETIELKFRGFEPEKRADAWSEWQVDLIQENP